MDCPPNITAAPSLDLSELSGSTSPPSNKSADARENTNLNLTHANGKKARRVREVSSRIDTGLRKGASIVPASGQAAVLKENASAGNRHVDHAGGSRKPTSAAVVQSKTPQRETWDLRGRLSDMEGLVKALKGQIQASHGDMQNMEESLGALQRVKDDLRTKHGSGDPLALSVSALSGPPAPVASASDVQAVHDALESAHAAAMARLSSEHAAELAALHEAVANARAAHAADVARLGDEHAAAMSLAEASQAARLAEAEAQMRDTLDRAVQAHDATIAELRSQETCLRAAHEAALVALQAEHSATMGDMQRMFSEVEMRCVGLANTCEELSAENESMRAGLAQQVASLGTAMASLANAVEAKQAAEMAVQNLTEAQARLATQAQTSEARVAALEAELVRLNEKRRSEEMARRALHNQVQELRGNIRVFCRVRPLLPSEQEELGESTGRALFSFPGENGDFTQSIVVRTPGRTGGPVTPGAASKDKELNFAFDKTFDSAASQADVFAEISQVVQSALDGYNVCLFAYGQTGSGKTYTMEGPPPGQGDADSAGMIPRTVEQIFATTARLAELGWCYRLSASYLEIYNETVRDLLAPGEDDEADRKGLELRLSPGDGTVQVPGLTVAAVTSPADIERVLAQARENRSVGRTNMNERSSRSHSVFTLSIAGEHAADGVRCEGSLNLIDLAGSERLGKSQASGQRLKETQAINKSLSALANCIAGIGKKQAHVPFRDSKLTFLLKNALSGSSKVLMIANVSPAPSSLPETVCTLRFATNVNNTVVGCSIKNVTAKSAAGEAADA